MSKYIQRYLFKQKRLQKAHYVYKVELELDPEWYVNNSNHKRILDKRITDIFGFRGKIIRSELKEKESKTCFDSSTI